MHLLHLEYYLVYISFIKRIGKVFMKYEQNSKNSLIILLFSCTILCASDSESPIEPQCSWQRRRSILPQPNSPSTPSHLSIETQSQSPRTQNSRSSSTNFEPIHPETNPEPITPTTSGNRSDPRSPEKIVRFKDPEISPTHNTSTIIASRESGKNNRWSTRKQFCTCLACIAGLIALNLGLTALNLHYLRTQNNGCQN